MSPWRASFVAQLVKNLPAMRETWVWSLGWEDPRRRKRLPTPVFWLGEFRGLFSSWDHKESDKRNMAQPWPQELTSPPTLGLFVKRKQNRTFFSLNIRKDPHNEISAKTWVSFYLRCQESKIPKQNRKKKKIHQEMAVWGDNCGVLAPACTCSDLVIKFSGIWQAVSLESHY